MNRVGRFARGVVQLSFVLILVLGMAFAQAPVASAQDEHASDEAVTMATETIDAILAAWVAADTDALDALTADDFAWIDASGNVLDRDGWLGAASGEAFQVVAMDRGDLEVKEISPEALFVTFPLDLTGVAEGVTWQSFEQDSALLEDTGDGWVVSFVQGTTRAEDTAAYEEELGAAMGVALSALPANMAEGAGAIRVDAETGASSLVKPSTNGMFCYGDSPLTEMVDPFCVDETMMAAANSMYAGETPELDRLAIGYALQGFAVANTTDFLAMQPAEGEEWVEFGPSIVFMAPNGFDAEQFSTDPASGGPVLAYDGQPLEMLVVPVSATTPDEAGDVDEVAAMAMSAAPPAVSVDATIITFADDGSAEILAEGTNSWVCFPNDPATPGGDPTCVDPQWAGFFDSFLAGEEPDVQGIGLSYMLQGGLTASNTDPMATEPAEGDDWVKDGPHIMVIMEGGFDESLYSTDHMTGGPYVMWAGTPYAHLMVPVAPFDEASMGDMEMEE